MGENNFTGIYFCDSVNGQTDVVNIPDVIAYANKIPEVSVTWQPTALKLTDAQKVGAMIKEKNLKKIVIAGDMPGLVPSTA